MLITPGAGAGGIRGGIIRARVGCVIPEARVKLYESGIEEEQDVIGVHSRNDLDVKHFQENWRTSNANKKE